MKRKQLRWIPVILGLGMAVAAALPVMSQEIPRISKEDLREMIGKSDLIIVDVRTGLDWDASTVKIKGAVREEADKVDSWIEKYPRDKTLVLY